MGRASFLACMFTNSVTIFAMYCGSQDKNTTINLLQEYATLQGLLCKSSTFYKKIKHR
jgi:hypothetical protein